jgi:hypothetical protein
LSSLSGKAPVMDSGIDTVIFGGVAAQFGDGAVAALSISSGATLSIDPAGAQTTVNDNAISGPVGTTYVSGINVPSANMSLTHAAMLGTIVESTKGGGAALLEYSGSTSGMDAKNVQAAIDEAAALKHRVISASVAITADDRNIGTAGLTGAIAPTLPSSAAVVPTVGKIWGCWIADEDGSASGTNSVTPTPTGGDTIVGAVTAITGAFGAIYVYTTGDTVWHAR